MVCQMSPLRKCVNDELEKYFNNLDGQQINDLYEVVIKEVEISMLRSVARYTKGNQSAAASMLGISRGTLRKKLNQYGIGTP